MTLCLKNLTIQKRSSETLFSNFNLTIKAGEIVSLMGPSGCGKSTLLSAIAGHLADDFVASGDIILNNASLNDKPAHLRKVGLLFQDDLLFPHLNIWQNLAFALPNYVERNERKERALEALNTLSLSGLAKSFPEQISGGQRARVSLTRMLLAKPELALLDEPFSKLDKELRIQFRDWVMEQLADANIPALMVTHDVGDTPSNGKLISWPWEASNA